MGVQRPTRRRRISEKASLCPVVQELDVQAVLQGQQPESCLGLEQKACHLEQECGPSPASGPAGMWPPKEDALGPKPAFAPVFLQDHTRLCGSPTPSSVTPLGGVDKSDVWSTFDDRCERLAAAPVASLSCFQGVCAAATQANAEGAPQPCHWDLAGKACRLVARRLLHATEEARACACSMLPLLLALATVRVGDESDELSRSVFVILLVQLSTTSPAVRAAALDAIVRLSRWDAEVFVRAVKIPPFRRADGGAPKVTVFEPEHWHGTLYFALDDECAAIRVGVLLVLQRAVNELSSSNTKLLSGVFQRIAALSCMCLLDGDSSVRSCASSVLIASMTRRSVELVQPHALQRTSSDDLLVSVVLQALTVDPALALRVLREARFGDGYALEVAVEGLLNLDLAESQAGSEELGETLEHLGKVCAHLLEPVGGLGCAQRRPGAGQCRGVGHRLFVKWHDPNNASRLQRLTMLLHAAGEVRPPLRTCIPDLFAEVCAGVEDPLELASQVDSARRASVTIWAQELGRCFNGLRDVGVRGCSAHWIRRVRHLERCCTDAAKEARPQAGSLAGNMLAMAAWSHLLCLVFEVLSLASSRRTAAEVEATDRVVNQALRQLGLEGKASSFCRLPRKCGEEYATQVHLATSRLMHCFGWGPSGFPKLLLAFRLFALRLLGDSYVEDFLSACKDSGATPEAAKMALNKPLVTFFPEVPASFFPAMLGADGHIEAHDCSLRGTGPDGVVLPPRFSSTLGGELEIGVRTTLGRGVRVRVTDPMGRRWSVTPQKVGRELRSRVPLEFPHPFNTPGVTMTLQALVSVDVGVGTSFIRGSTGVRASHPAYGELNELPLGEPLDVPFSVT